MRKTVVIKTDLSMQRLDQIQIGDLNIQLTYDPNQNIMSFIFDAPKKTFPDDPTILKTVTEINTIWGSILRSTNFLAANANQNTNKTNSTIINTGGKINLIQPLASDYQVNTGSLNPIFTVNPTNGNILYAAIATRSFPVVTVANITQVGVVWTYVNSQTLGNAIDVEIWKGVIGANATVATTVNLTAAAASGAVVDVIEVAGTKGTADVSATNSNVGSANPDSGTTAATSTASEIWIAALNTESDGITPQTNPTNNFTLLDGASHPAICLALCYYIASAKAAADCTTTSGNGAWVGCITTFT